MITDREIEQGLTGIGLETEDLVLVHGSLSSFGRVSGGADALVNAILAIIGPKGTLVVPTFNYAPDAFHPDETPSVVGAITETVRKHPNALRSHHPTHSVAAIGPLAEQITKDHEKVDPFGPGSALYKLFKLDGKVLLIGIGHTRNSMIHVAEELASVPYLDRVRQVTVKMPNGRLLTKIIRRPGCSQGFDQIAESLETAGAIRQTHIGSSFVQLMSAGSIIKAATELTQEDPTALLCEQPDCQACAEARAMVVAHEEQVREQELAAFLRDPVGEDIRPFEDSWDASENGESRN